MAPKARQILYSGRQRLHIAQLTPGFADSMLTVVCRSGSIYHKQCGLKLELLKARVPVVFNQKVLSSFSPRLHVYHSVINSLL